MTDEEVKFLELAIKNGQNVYWLNDGEVRKIIKILPYILSKDERLYEPGPCAFLQDGTYIGLWNTTTDELVVINPLFGN